MYYFLFYMFSFEAIVNDSKLLASSHSSRLRSVPKKESCKTRTLPDKS
ncbi:MAG: hypothetical protein ACD_8C00101G0004 [uncultured bacterium]|nr:MAG: hypothetical protein ACD_8C00101G0004 [uncultured bacterium]